MEYYAAIKRNEILPFAMTWIELEGIMLCEIGQSRKDNYHVISLTEEFERQDRRLWGIQKEKMKQNETREGDKLFSYS